MKNLPKIGILLAAIILCAHTVSPAGTGTLHDTVKLMQAQQERSASTYPTHTAFLLPMQHPAESGVNFGEQLPVPQSAEHSPYADDPYARAVFALQQYAKKHHCLCRSLYRRLTLKKLIFPFHSHW